MIGPNPAQPGESRGDHASGLRLIDAQRKGDRSKVRPGSLQGFGTIDLALQGIATEEPVIEEDGHL